MPPLPYAIRVPGAARALRYCATDAAAEHALYDGLNNGMNALSVEYYLRPVLTLTQDEFRAWLARHGVWNEMLNNGRGGYHIPPEHRLLVRIKAGVDALGPDPLPGLRGTRRRALAAELVARGLSPADAEDVVRAHM